MARKLPVLAKKHQGFLQRLHNSAVWNFLSVLIRELPAKVALAVVLMVAASFTEGIGLILLLPLLQLIGFPAQSGSIEGITNYLTSFFALIGLPLTLVSVLGVYVAVMCFYALFTRWQSITSSSIQFDFQARLRQRLYRAIVNTNWLFFSRNRASTFTHALTAEIDRVGWGTQQMLQFLATLLVLFVYLFIALQISALTTGIVVLFGLVLLFVLRKKIYVARRKGESVSTNTKDLYGAITEHLDGMKTVKSYGAQETNISIFSDLNKSIKNSYIAYVRNSSDMEALFTIGSVVILSAALIVLIDVLHLPAASVLLLLFLFFRIIPQFSGLQRSYQAFVNMLPSFENVQSVQARCEAEAERELDLHDEIPLQSRITVEDASFKYEDNTRPAVDRVSVAIQAGKMTAIVGPSGAGKTTLADLIMGLIEPQTGRICIDAIPLDHERLYAWRNKIGYVAQETFLFNDTVRANLLWAAPTATDDDLRDALHVAAAEEFVTDLPQGLDTVLGDRGVRLSGGESQRLALARALLRKPTLLLLDEATSNLDSENERRVQNAIDALHGDMSIVIITHRLSTVRNADIIHVLEKGEIVESGTWTSLLDKKQGRFRKLCEVQGVA